VADPVIFDRSSAERIASAVRRVEIGDRTESPLRFDAVTSQQRKAFRIATFTGAWAINATKTVTFKYQTATPNTASVVNLFFPYPAVTGATDCAIAKDGSVWHLIDVPFQTATAVFASSTATAVAIGSTASASFASQTATALAVLTTSTQAVVSGISIAASLNTNNCEIVVSTTQTTSTVRVVQTTGTMTIVAATSSAVFVASTASIAVMKSTFTSTFVRFGV